MGIVFFGVLFLAVGTIETVQEEIHYAKKKREYEMRRWRMKHRWIA